MNALDWVAKNAGKGQYAHINGSRITTAGQSCGGLETYNVAVKAGPQKVQAVGIFNNGEFGTSSTSKMVKQPIFYFLGGPSDIAY
jgi:dienelactone hydrolase